VLDVLVDQRPRMPADLAREAGVSSGVVHAMAKQGKGYDALTLLGDMESKPDNVKPDVVSYNSALSALSHDPSYPPQDAMEFLERMKASDIQPDKVSYTCEWKSSNLQPYSQFIVTRCFGFVGPFQRPRQSPSSERVGRQDGLFLPCRRVIDQT